jgi:hypothetical protein
VNGAWRVLCGWGLLLVAIAALNPIFFGASATEIALLGGAGAWLVTLGLLSVVVRRPRPVGDAPEVVPAASPGAVALAAGVALFVLGWEVGQWLIAIGGGVALGAVVVLVRER